MNIHDNVLRAMFLSRVSFLKPAERLKLFKMECGLSDFMSMDTGRLARMLGRRVLSKKWNPRYICAQLDWHRRWLEAGQGWAVTIDHESYPPMLAAIDDPPVVLYGRGSKAALHAHCIAVVGTRMPSAWGRDAARDLGYGIARMGGCVVSGLAYGIDICAHEGALRAVHSGVCAPHTEASLSNADENIMRLSRVAADTVSSESCISKNDAQNTACPGKPIAVLGTGIDYIYPADHTPQASAILSCGGALISEMPPCARDITRKHSFIGRNRIISGLCTAVIVVQCPKKSGALATADFALQQGRTVAVHSCGLSESFNGTRILHENGAPCVDAPR